MNNKIKGTRFDPQNCPICGKKLNPGKPLFRWYCKDCNKPFAISNSGLGDEIIEVVV